MVAGAPAKVVGRARDRLPGLSMRQGITNESPTFCEDIEAAVRQQLGKPSSPVASAGAGASHDSPVVATTPAATVTQAATEEQDAYCLLFPDGCSVEI